MMANDLISCALALVIGAGGLIAVRRYDKKLPEYNRRRRQLEGMRYAYRAMRPVMRVLKKR